MRTEGRVADDSPDGWAATRSRVIRNALGIALATGAYALSFGAISVAVVLRAPFLVVVAAAAVTTAAIRLL